MRRSVFVLLATITVAVVFCRTASAELIVGDVINIDLQRSANGVDATGNDGPFSQTGSPHWNILEDDNGTGSNLPLLDAGGEDDGLTFSATGLGSWLSNTYPSTEPNGVTYDFWYDDSNPLPFSIDNVPAGTYDLYIVAGVSHYTDGQTTSVSVTGAGSKNIAWPDDEAAGGNTSLPLPWVEGTNYAKFTVTLASPGTISGNVNLAGNSILNGLQLVAVPEPSTFVLSLGLALLGLICLTRRSR